MMGCSLLDSELKHPRLRRLLLNHRRCQKLFWLTHNKPESQKDSEDAKRRAEDGLRVGELSRQRLGKVLWISAEDTPRNSAAKARFELATNHLPAVEVPMWHDDVYARADALIPTHGGYRIQETKANKHPGAKKPDKNLVADVAVQAWVMQESGIAYVGADLVLLDGDFAYQGGGNYQGLFKPLDVTEEVAAVLIDVPAWVDAADETSRTKTEPVVAMGGFCNDPPCPFKDYCDKQANLYGDPQKTPLTVLPDLAGKNLAKKLKAKGYGSLQEVPTTELAGNDQKTTDLYRRIQKAHALNAPVITQSAKDLIAACPYPHAHFDFEGIDHAVPVWVGLHPYEQVTFQFSVHIQRSQGEPFEHREFLDLSGKDPTLACIMAMRDALPTSGTIFVYHKTYEASRLKEMQSRHPEHHEMIEGWLGRLVDLLPMVKQNYYHPVQHGSFSIKKVLKAICPSLDYAQLNGVHNGTEAQLAYLKATAPGATKAQVQAIGAQLLAYCRLDTLSMVKVADGLSTKEP